MRKIGITLCVILVAFGLTMPAAAYNQKVKDATGDIPAKAFDLKWASVNDTADSLKLTLKTAGALKPKVKVASIIPTKQGMGSMWFKLSTNASLGLPDPQMYTASLGREQDFPQKAGGPAKKTKLIVVLWEQTYNSETQQWENEEIARFDVKNTFNKKFQVKIPRDLITGTESGNTLFWSVGSWFGTQDPDDECYDETLPETATTFLARFQAEPALGCYDDLPDEGNIVHELE